MAFPHRLFGRLAALLLALALPGPTPAGRGGDDALRAWISGPIRYVATPDEVASWKSLRSDAERLAFVERFWARRDPTPKTLANEARQTFWERVRIANERFTDRPGAGWRTDRGKIYILHGEPNEVEESPYAKVGSRGQTGYGLVRWIYDRSIDRPGLDPVVVVAFARSPDGEYRLTTDPKLTSLSYNSLFHDDATWRAWETLLGSSAEIGRRSPLSVQLDLGELQQVPAEEQVLIERVTTSTAFGTVPLPVAVSRHRRPQDGAPLVVLTVAIPGGGEPPALLARFAPRDATRSPVLLGEGDFRVEGQGPDRLAQARAALAPGTWEVTALAADPERGSTGLYTGTLEVAAPPGPGPALSDLELVRDLATLPYATLISHDEPFVLGPFRAVPRPSRSILRGEVLHVLYEVYGGTPPFAVSHHLEGREDDGRWTPLGAPQVLEIPASGSRVQAWSLPTGAFWPAGTYRVRVEVRDAAGGRAEGSREVLLEAAAP